MESRRHAAVACGDESVEELRQELVAARAFRSGLDLDAGRRFGAGPFLLGYIAPDRQYER
jgi:hypothetical protein